MSEKFTITNRHGLKVVLCIKNINHNYRQAETDAYGQGFTELEDALSSWIKERTL